MKKTSFVLPILLLLCGMSYAQSVINVSAGQSIQNAINNANSGDTIRVASGIFDESLFINKRIVLEGAGSGLTVLRGADNGTRAYDERRTILVFAYGTVIDGLTITQASSEVDNNHNTMGILLEATSDVTIRNCKIQNHITGIYISGASNSVIENNLFANCGNGVLFASFFRPSNRNFIINNEIVGNAIANETDDAGIKLIPNYGGSNNKVTGNNIYANGFGINNQSTSVLDAEKNWWWSPSGPRHSTNPGGLGDEVSDFVIFSPFATSPSDNATLNEIKGTAFFDENGNQIKDANEVGLPFQSVMLLPDSISAVTDSDGNYRFTMLDGDYSVKLTPAGIWETSKDTLQATFPGSSREGYDFALTPTTEAYDVKSYLSSGFTRCGFTISYWLSYRNNGAIRTDGKVKLLPDSKATFVSATVNPTTTSNDTLIWDFSDLQPYESRQIRLRYTMPGVDFLGDSVSFMHFVEAINNGEIVAQDSDSLISEIRCAYDPNDKTATPAGIFDQNFTLKDETIDYRIRFQNTGTDTAFNVVIRDTIQEDFDLNSFEIISTSHQMRTEIDVKEKAIAFYFDDILLPDSTTNEPESHGFINFRIEPKAGLEDGTEVYNTAHIYFDFNPAIVTNTTLNTLVDELPTERPVGTEFEDITSAVNLFPNPSNGDEVFVSVENSLQGGYQIILTDLMGKQVSTHQVSKQQAQQNFRLDTAGLERGIYILQIIQGDKRAVKKLVRE